MKQSDICQMWVREAFHGSDIVRRYTFKALSTWVNYALLARANHLISFGFVSTREESAHMMSEDCFECLPPHGIAV